MKVIAWIVEGTWPACVDAARVHAPGGAGIVLLHVTGPGIPAAAHGAYAGLLGRGRLGRDPGPRLENLGAAAARQLLHDAAERLGRPCTRLERSGRIEREVIAAAEDAGLLILARDGDRTRLGPKSLGPASRFVIDHAPCPVLLVWPEPAPGVATIPTAPHRRTTGRPPGLTVPVWMGGGPAQDEWPCWQAAAVAMADDPARKALLRRGFALEYVTLAWNVAGIVVLAIAAVGARSVALAGFGLDSLIEIGASTVVIWELSGTGESASAAACG